MTYTAEKRKSRLASLTKALLVSTPILFAAPAFAEADGGKRLDDFAEATGAETDTDGEVSSMGGSDDDYEEADGGASLSDFAEATEADDDAGEEGETNDDGGDGGETDEGSDDEAADDAEDGAEDDGADDADDGTVDEGEVE